jgi:hypothetical protein
MQEEGEKDEAITCKMYPTVAQPKVGTV